VVPAYFPVRGGIEVLIENLCSGIHEKYSLTSAVMACTSIPNRPQSYVHRGVVVETIEPMRVEHDNPQTPVIPHNQGIERVSRVFSRVREILDTLRPRLVHLHGSTSVTSPVLSVLRSRNTPFILHVHGTIHEYHRAAYRRIARDTPWMCAVSEAVAQSIRDDCSRTGPITLIRNGLPDPLPSTIPFDPRSPSVAMIGRLSEEKGFDDGLRALARVRASIPNLTIRLAGNGPELDSLHRLAGELGLLESIEFFGELPHDRALRVVAGCDITLVPSKGIEGFSLIAAEAALLERPVIATNVGGLAETVLDGVTGVLVPAASPNVMSGQIMHLLADTNLRLSLGAAARTRALALFGHERFVDEVAELYGRVFAEQRSATSER
jgi:glycosyltransferase involved in cell wall biosynthesis